MALVSCAGVEIEQVLLNLLINAACAMKNGNTRIQPKITLRLSIENDQAKIEVEDNGPGMDEKTRKRIFEPFSRKNPLVKGQGSDSQLHI